MKQLDNYHKRKETGIDQQRHQDCKQLNAVKFLSAISLLKALQVKSIKELEGGNTFEIGTFTKSAICLNISWHSLAFLAKFQKFQKF